MTESHTYAAYRLAATPLGARLFRNNVGVFYTRTGRRVRVGLQPGSGDLIGWQTVTVTPDLVGATLAVFLSLEVKLPGGHTQPRVAARQERWREAVERAGGIGLQCYSVDEMRAALA